MSVEWECAQVRDLIPELAVGVASGEERARALQHLAHCSECRRELEQLAELADELLLLAPDREPPPGFESRVLDQLTGKRRRRWRTVALAAAAAVIVGAVGAGAVYRWTSHDRVLAAEYREVLSDFDGLYFQTATLEGSPSGADGQVFAYQGSPPWVFLVVPGQAEEEYYEVMLETRMGEQLHIGGVEVSDEGGSWGKAIPVDLKDIARLRLENDDGHALEARLERWEG
ncbi:MAG TPA: zf-HC2 domain-containing protein [Actinomycetota bacterium]|jgi:hypothetical protein